MRDAFADGLTLNKSFYDSSSVNKAAKEFRKACRVNIKKIKKGILVTLKPKSSPKKASSNIEGEFANYVLALMKNEGVV